MLLQMSPTNFSAHPWVLPAADVTVVFQRCFFYFPHAFYIYHLEFFCKEDVTLSSNYLFNVARMNSGMFIF